MAIEWDHISGHCVDMKINDSWCRRCVVRTPHPKSGYGPWSFHTAHTNILFSEWHLAEIRAKLLDMNADYYICADCNKNIREWDVDYMLKDEVWETQCHGAHFLCLPCFEARRGAPIGPEDLKDVWANEELRRRLE